MKNVYEESLALLKYAEMRKPIHQLERSENNQITLNTIIK